MGFEIVKKKPHGLQIMPNMISIGKHHISFGEEVLSFFKKYTHIEIYLDRIESKVGFKGTMNPITGFKIQKKQKHAAIYARNVMPMIPVGKSEVEFEEDMAIIKVPSMQDAS